MVWEEGKTIQSSKFPGSALPRTLVRRKVFSKGIPVAQYAWQMLLSLRASDVFRAREIHAIERRVFPVLQDLSISQTFLIQKNSHCWTLVIVPLGSATSNTNGLAVGLSGLPHHVPDRASAWLSPEDVIVS